MFHSSFCSEEGKLRICHTLVLSCYFEVCCHGTLFMKRGFKINNSLLDHKFQKTPPISELVSNKGHIAWCVVYWSALLVYWACGCRRFSPWSAVPKQKHDGGRAWKSEAAQFMAARTQNRGTVTRRENPSKGSAQCPTSSTGHTLEQHSQPCTPTD